MKHILAIDQGTTSSRAILFDESLRPKVVGQQEFAQHFPQAGWVEHDAEEIWRTTLTTCNTALSGCDVSSVAAIGITNQRETVVVWDRETGAPIHNAIVWQDRRTSDMCVRLKADGHEPMITARTGLLLDPYFSASKIAWLLDNIDGARARADAGKLLFGTIDSFLIWRLTAGRVHATDATNASRTMLYNIVEGRWDSSLLDLFNIPEEMLPDVRDCSSDYGESAIDLFGRTIPIRGVAGDQQAATVGQACFKPGMMKSTYGTGCFALMNTGSEMVTSKNRLLTTVAYQLDGTVTYALEGSIFVAGSAVQWLRDGIGVLADASETMDLAKAADPSQKIYMVPAFTGLGAPYWDAECRGALFGLTRGTGPAELAKAALEAVAFQTRDLVEAMHADFRSGTDTVLRVDGGMVANDWVLQVIADQLAAPVDRPVVAETTALGAAYLAGYGAGMFGGPEHFQDTWKLDKRFEPRGDAADHDAAYAGWKDAVRRTLGAIK